MVDATAGGLADDVEPVDDIGVVASAAFQRVLAGRAVEEVVACATLQRVGARAASQEVVADAAVEGVVAAVSGQHVVAGAAIQRVGEAVAQDVVVEAVAGAIERSAHQLEVLDIGGEGEADHADNGVLRALVEQFGHHVAGLVDEIGVVAGATAHRVGAREAVQCVVIVATGQHIVAAGPDLGEHVPSPRGGTRMQACAEGCRETPRR